MRENKEEEGHFRVLRKRNGVDGKEMRTRGDGCLAKNLAIPFFL